MWKSPRLIALSLVFLAALCGAAWVSFSTAERFFLGRLAEQNQATLRLVAAGLEGALSRYEPLPALIADKNEVAGLLSKQAQPGDTLAVNLELKRIVSDVRASDIYVMDRTGLTVAASNFDTDKSFTGRNFAFRPYFSDAVAGQPALYYAFGITSLKRGFFFSAPVRGDNGIIGVVAVKIEVEAIEDSWRGSATRVLVTDPSGIIFMASEPEWLFNSLTPLSDAQRQEIIDSRQYPTDRLAALPVETGEFPAQDMSRWQIGEGQQTRAYLSGNQPVSDIGLTLHVLTPMASVTGSAATVMAVVLLAMLLLALIAGVVLQRRRRLLSDMERQRRDREELELRVDERTRDLNEANSQLTIEVKERTNAEEQLRSTQRELIQAGKLAALGQMSAALSHELNQPLAAIKSYADNAKAYLNLGKADQASDNIGRISEMADRMAELGRHLRNFARKPKQKFETADLADVFDAVSQIMSARLKETGAQLEIQDFEEPVMVVGGSVRLQQVLVNLVNNALDAMNSLPKQRVEVTADFDGEEVQVVVRDFGRGIGQSDIDQIFDPFYTTKDVNEGLGLGLSISFNIIQDFGGHLSAANHPKGGAMFKVTLKRADAIRSAAE